MKQEDIDEMRRIVEKYIPLGNIASRCHSFICPIEKCSRCQDAATIRRLLNELELFGHIGK